MSSVGSAAPTQASGDKLTGKTSSAPQALVALVRLLARQAARESLAKTAPEEGSDD